MNRTFRGDLEQQLKDPEFAGEFGAAQAKSSLALTLAKARGKVGLTQGALATKMGVSQAYVAKLEGGEANPTFGRVGSLLAIVGLSLATDTVPLWPYSTVSSSATGGVSDEQVEPVFWGPSLIGHSTGASPHSEALVIS